MSSTFFISMLKVNKLGLFGVVGVVGVDRSCAQLIAFMGVKGMAISLIIVVIIETPSRAPCVFEFCQILDKRSRKDERGMYCKPSPSQAQGNLDCHAASLLAARHLLQGDLNI
jgi:hypothetical protein